MSWIESKAKSIAEFVYRNFEAKGSGNMILLTTMAGIALSTIAQTIAIIANNKYSAPQKAFMIPQELTDGCITIYRYFLLLLRCKNFHTEVLMPEKSTQMRWATI